MSRDLIGAASIAADSLETDDAEGKTSSPRGVLDGGPATAGYVPARTSRHIVKAGHLRLRAKLKAQAHGAALL